MGYRIEGDGSWHHTKVWKNGVPVENWNSCVISIDELECVAWVDTNPDLLDRVVLTGVYMLIGDGKFYNTKLMNSDSVLRGVQRIKITIERNKDPIIDIMAIFLPNIVEGEASD
jgi:hypothetical protein